MKVALLLLFVSAFAAVGARSAPATARKGSIPLMGKPTAPVSLAYTVSPENPQPGQVAVVQLKIQVLDASSEVKFQATANKRVSIAEGEGEKSLGALGAGASVSETLHVSVEKAGNAYIHVRVSGIFDGQPQTRMMAVPVNRATRAGDDERQVGTPKPARGRPAGGASKVSGKMSGSGSPDDNVISMPADES